eukprot:TRINITY_DN1055_c0_g1_i2.p1 TRINITY_DN1055_c0_g1~~TRINITY_DN1055_c0_g1_i2.p1  ORF type:complete len:492 (-),score=36.16 TRINITY_DN1055_c0_g1_i2:370-1845(-)
MVARKDSLDLDVGPSDGFISKTQKRLKHRKQEEYETDEWGKTLEQQEIGVAQLRQAVITSGYPQAAQFDYYMLLRFLRGRDYDVEKATEMVKNHIQWRYEYGTDTIIEDFDFKERNQFLAVYPQGYHKTDKQGRPIYIQHLGCIDLKKITQVTTVDRMIRFHVQEWERCIKTIFPACSRKAGRRIDQMFAIMDVQGVGLHMLSADVRRTLQEITKIDQDNYPESLGKVFIINAPIIFKAVWKFIHPLLNPRTRGKIELYGQNYKQALLEHVDIDSIPQYLGGNSKETLVDDVGPWNDPKYQVISPIDNTELVPLMLKSPRLREEGGIKRASSPVQDSAVEQPITVELKQLEKSSSEEDGFFTPRAQSFSDESIRSQRKEENGIGGPQTGDIELQLVTNSKLYDLRKLSLIERIQRVEEFVRPRLLTTDENLIQPQLFDSPSIPLISRVENLEEACEVLLMAEEARQKHDEKQIENLNQSKSRYCCCSCTIM